MQGVQDGEAKVHVAIIMDGNGRWATRQGLPRARGHEAGMEAVRRTVEAAAELGVGTLTLFAFAASNWKRPPAEVEHLMWLFQRYLRADLDRFVEQGARVTMIGRRDRLAPGLRREVERAEDLSAQGRRIHVRIAVDYSSREAIAQAAAAWAQGAPPPRALFGETRLLAAGPPDERAADVDLLIRTGGERRLSDFLLWECAFAELWFTDVMWPDFGAEDLAAALEDYARRQRRFGATPEQARPALEPA